KRLQFGERNRREGREYQADTAGNGDLAFPEAKGLTCQGNRRERRRTSGVDRDAWSPEVQQIGKPPGDRAPRSSAAVDIHAQRVRQLHVRIVAVERADADATH